MTRYCPVMRMVVLAIAVSNGESCETIAAAA